MATYDDRNDEQPSGPPPGTTGSMIWGTIILLLIIYGVNAFLQAAKLNHSGF